MMLVAIFSRGREFPAQLLKRHALHDHAAGAGHRRQKEPFAAKDSGLDATHHLNVVADRLVEGHDAARIDLQHLAHIQAELDEVAAAMDEYLSGTCEPFEDE